MSRSASVLESRAEEVIQEHLDGHLRKSGAMSRRKRRRLTPKPSIIEEAVRRKFQEKAI